MAIPKTIKLYINGELEKCPVRVVVIDGADEYECRSPQTGLILFFPINETDDKGKTVKRSLKYLTDRYNETNATGE